MALPLVRNNNAYPVKARLDELPHYPVRLLEDMKLALEAIRKGPLQAAILRGGLVGIDQSLAGLTNFVESRANVRRAGPVLHRNAITTADVLAVPGDPTVTDIATGGVLLAGTTYKVGVIAVKLQAGSGSILGLSTVNANIQSVTTASDASNTHAARAAFSAVTNAGGYLLFCSTDAAPKLAGYITEAQRAAGGILTAFATVGAGGAAGSMDIGLAGTGLQTSNSVFTVNTAHTPDVVAAIGNIPCVGYTKAYLTVRAKLSLTTVWSAAPALKVIPWIKTQRSSDWAAGSAVTLSLLTNNTDSMTQVTTFSVEGATALVVTAPTVTGLASFDVEVELT